MYGERLVSCGAREGEERKDSGRGRGAAACAAGTPQGGLDHTTGAGGEEDVRDRGGVGEGRDLAGCLGEVGGAAAPVRRAPSVSRLSCCISPPRQQVSGVSPTIFLRRRVVLLRRSATARKAAACWRGVRQRVPARRSSGLLARSWRPGSSRGRCCCLSGGRSSPICRAALSPA